LQSVFHASPISNSPQLGSGFFRGASISSCRLVATAGRRQKSPGPWRVVAALPEALLFDCDGVLVDTERDGHRVSFNKAFEEKGLQVTWDVALYGKLLEIGGGKERMTHYFNGVGWPETVPEPQRKDFVAGLHKRKTDLFMDLVESGQLPLRPGVATLVDEALSLGVQVAVCSTSNERAVSAIVRVMLGDERAAAMQIFAGDVVPKKKPDPAIYQLAASTLNVQPERCVVIEDSHIGLAAAKAAGMVCIVTKSGYTENEDFAKADAVFPCIGDPPSQNFDLSFASSLIKTESRV
jgi:HAD superfamily hydrolase (TIGR01509 family)